MSFDDKELLCFSRASNVCGPSGPRPPWRHGWPSQGLSGYFAETKLRYQEQPIVYVGYAVFLSSPDIQTTEWLI